MKFRITLFLSVFVISILILNNFWITNKNLFQILPNEQFQLSNQLAKQIAVLNPDSKQASKLNRISTKLRKLRKGEINRAENPGELLEAFRQIKAAPDGKIYESDYRRKELEKALKKRERQLKKANPLPWIERGPGNVSGRSRALIVDPDDESGAGNTWFVGTVGGGIWKTTNAGITWENKTPELTTLSTVCMAQAKSNPNIIYVGTGMGYGRTVDLAGNGIWKSIDRGEIWTNLPNTANGELLPAINRIIIDPNEENIVLVCSNGDYTSNGPNDGSRVSGIFRTIDGGESWTQVYDPEPVFGPNTDNRVQQIIANPDNFNEMYGAVNEIGVIKSLDGGLTWFTVADNFADLADIGYGEGTYQGISTRTELAISPSDPTRIYASVERRRGVSKLFMSKDSGRTWDEVIDIGNNPNWFSYYGANGANSYTGGWFDNTIVVHPYDENIVFVGGIEIYRIIVDPNNNTRITNVVAPVGTIHVDHHYLATIPINESTNEFKILNANDGGVGISNDGGNSWTQIVGLASTQFYGIDKMPGSDKYIGGTQDNGTWLSPSKTNLESNWSHVLGGDGFETAWNYWNPNLVIGCSQGGNYSRSTNGGLSWSAMPDARAGNNAPFISKIAGSKADADMLFTVGIDGIKRSDDFGASWTLTRFNSDWIGWRAFDNVEISIADPQVVWISSRMRYEDFIGREGGIHHSRDGGLTFAEISDNFPPTVIEASGISTDPFDPATAYFLFSAASQPKVLRTKDYGETFEDLSGFSGLPKTAGESGNGFPDVAVYQILVMPYNTDVLWAGTEIGLFISEDDGATWTIADNGFPSVGIFQMSIVDDQILVATYGRGIWTVTLPELASYSPQEVTLVPRLKQLAQNTEGEIEINVELRSAYDSTVIKLNNERLIVMPENSSPKDTTILFSVFEPSNLNAFVSSYVLGREYRTPNRSISAEPIEILSSYFTDFESPDSGDDIESSSAKVKTELGFSNPALHFPHPYFDATDLTAKIKNPILLGENSILSFDEVVLVEEGIVNSYTNPNFFDYVIVEGSKDGLNWLPLIDGYDSRDNLIWSTRYNSNISGQNSLAKGDELLYRNREINLLNTFNVSDIIFTRFRLHADPLAYGWGWVIDNLSIQSDLTDSTEELKLPTEFKLSQNYPNPFNPSTTIIYSIPREMEVSIKVFDALGREVSTLINKKHFQGEYEVEFNNSGLSSGVYYYKIEANNFSETKKMISLK